VSAHAERTSGGSSRTAGGGLGCLGAPLAGMLSVKSWGFTWWLLLHVPLGWLYVAYWVVFRSGWLG
jgi:hypothetical protein